MKTRKARLTVTVDRALVDAATAAVTAGRADSLSAWVNHALAEQAIRERRLAALAELVGEYEAEFGTITPDALAARQREDRRSAVIVRGTRRRPTRRGGRTTAA
jgi:hypothetical protein